LLKKKIQSKSIGLLISSNNEINRNGLSGTDTLDLGKEKSFILRPTKATKATKVKVKAVKGRRAHTH
jgi:hypothetical protein